MLTLSRLLRWRERARYLYHLASYRVVNGWTAVLAPRSVRWPALARAHLDVHPNCAACGGSVALHVHHALPYDRYPDKELDVGNLVTLCMREGFECHFLLGHGGDWRTYNPHVKDHVRELARGRPREDVLTEAAYCRTREISPDIR